MAEESAKDARTAHVVMHHDPSHPSYLEIPVAKISEKRKAAREAARLRRLANREAELRLVREIEDATIDLVTPGGKLESESALEFGEGVLRTLNRLKIEKIE